MNGFWAMQRRELRALWQKGYGDEVRRAAIVAPVLLLAGFVSTWFFPQIGDNLVRFVLQSTDLAQLASADAKNVASAIFLNNVTAAFSAILWGLVPFAYLAAFPLGLNFFLVGVMGAYSCQNDLGLGLFLAGILPHGVVELPTLVLFCAAGLYLCSRMTARVRGDQDVGILSVLSDISRLFLTLILPLLIVSALLEGYVTPWVMQLVTGA